MNRLHYTSVFLICLVLLAFSSCQLGRYIYYNFADIKDHKIFPSRKLISPENHFEFPTAINGKIPREIRVSNRKEPLSLDEMLKINQTVAFLIIKDDTIQYERYFDTYTKENIIPSFSMAKSVTSILIGCALEDSLIKNINEPLTNYVPELKKNGFDAVTIEHLMQMTSGIKFDESYFNPFGEAAGFYYGKNVRKRMTKLRLKYRPGTHFAYSSGDTQLLGWILERALKGKTITDYLQEKIWTPLEMEFDASWSLDDTKHKMEKTYCCLNARARDFAKIGRLYLNKGNWNGKQLVSKTWVETSTTPVLTNGGVAFYRYQWWIPSPKGDFMAEGILGQFVYVNPKKNLIIVRMGKNYGSIDWSGLFQALAASY